LFTSKNKSDAPIVKVAVAQEEEEKDDLEEKSHSFLESDQSVYENEQNQVNSAK